MIFFCLVQTWEIFTFLVILIYMYIIHVPFKSLNFFFRAETSGRKGMGDKDGRWEKGVGEGRKELVGEERGGKKEKVWRRRTVAKTCISTLYVQKNVISKVAFY